MLAKDLLQLLKSVSINEDHHGFGCEPWYRWCEGYVISGLDKIYLVFNDNIYASKIPNRFTIGGLKLLLKKYLDKKIIFISDLEIESESVPQPTFKLLGARYFEPIFEDMTYRNINFRFKESVSLEIEFKCMTKENYIKLLENIRGE